MSSTLPASSPVLTFNPTPTRPLLKLPKGACDTHVHLFGPAAQFAYSATRKFTPVDAPKETLFALHRMLGIERCVIVQSVVHGFDNAVVLDAIRASEGRYLGVALAPVDISDEALKSFARSGIRALRFHFMKHLGAANNVDEVIALTKRLAPLGMHLQVHFESALVHELTEPFGRSAVPVVIDHMGRVDARLGLEHADVSALIRLLDKPMFRVKISGIDRVDAQHYGPSEPYAAGIKLARHLLERFPDQCLWGTDWPHPNHTHVPDDGVLTDALSQIAGTPTLLSKLLVDNPQALYRFAH